MKGKLIIALFLAVLSGVITNSANAQTYCNPVNLDLPFDASKQALPNLSDPSVVLFKNAYFLFATNATGYWESTDLMSWKFISAPRLPLDKEAPTTTVSGDWLYFFTSRNDTIYRTKDPSVGKWEVYSTSILIPEISDFAIFTDTDSKVFSYYGCTNNDGIMSREMDPKDLLKPIKTPVVCQKLDLKATIRKTETKPAKKSGTYVQGSWMNKYNGTYYYQTTEANGELNNSAGVVYVSDNPQGPFKYAPNNPFAYKPNGFTCTIGSGSTFEDKYGNWWHITTVGASVNRKNQSALALFPAGFDSDGNLFVKTDFGDYPIFMPNRRNPDVDKLSPKWFLLSDHIIAKASSDQAVKTTAFAVDENIGTSWSALSGKKGEWLSIDLGSMCTVNALQVIFAQSKPQNIVYDSIYANQFIIEYSTDDKNWKKLSDHSADTIFRMNFYEEMKIPVQARYLKITNRGIPAGNFAIAEFRAFGSGNGRKPAKVKEFKAVRDYHNPNLVKLYWKKQPNTAGYNIRFGTDKDKLYHSYQVYNINRLTLTCPDKKGSYWFGIDAYNQNGVSPGKPMMIK